MTEVPYRGTACQLSKYLSTNSLYYVFIHLWYLYPPSREQNDVNYEILYPLRTLRTEAMDTPGDSFHVNSELVS
jgi:hypothetical protein